MLLFSQASIREVTEKIKTIQQESVNTVKFFKFYQPKLVDSSHPGGIENSEPRTEILFQEL